MLHLFREFEKEGFDIEKRIEAGVFYFRIGFRDMQ